MKDVSSGLDACGRCGCPLVGNESYCSNCGHRLGAHWPRPRMFAAVIFLLALGAVGTCFYHSRRVPLTGGQHSPVRQPIAR
jgi:hypothetical protein